MGLDEILTDHGYDVFIPPQAGRINLTHAHTGAHVNTALEAAKIAANDFPDP